MRVGRSSSVRSRRILRLGRDVVDGTKTAGVSISLACAAWAKYDEAVAIKHAAGRREQRMAARPSGTLLQVQATQAVMAPSASGPAGLDTRGTCDGDMSRVSKAA